MRYNRMANLAAILCEAPIALISIPQDDTIYLREHIGLPISYMPKEGSFYEHAIKEKDFFEVPDIKKDKRFANNILASDELGIRSYCGFPIRDENNEVLGVLAVMDKKTRVFSEEQKRGLKLITSEISNLIGNIHDTIIAKHTANQYRTFYDNTKGLMCSHDLNGKFITVNNASINSVGYSKEELLNMSLYDLIPKEYHHSVDQYLKQVKQNKRANGMMKIRSKDGPIKIWLYNNVLYKDLDGKEYVLGSALDITIRHNLEIEHRRLKVLLEQTNRVARIGGWEVDLVRNELFWSSVTKEIHEVPQSFVPELTKGINFYKEGYSRDMITQAVNDAISDGTPWDLELQIITAKGKELWVRAIGNAEFENGICMKLYGTFQDINDKKKAELEILNSRKQLENLLSAATEVSIIATDTEGVITVFNKGAENLLGYTAEEMINKRTPAIIHEEAETIERGKELSAIYNEPIEGFKVFVRVCQDAGSEQREWTYIRKDGKKLPVSLVVSAVRNADNQITGYLGIALDMSERKKAEEALVIERARLSAFVAHAPAAVAMFDTDLKYIAYSKRWLEEYRIEKPNITGLSHYEVFPNISQEWKDIHQRCLKGEVISNEEDIWRPEGWDHDQYLRWEVRPWYKFDGEIGGIMMLTQDVTAAALQREELKKAKLQAEQASIAKSEFLANMSHEIRTPLNGVIGFTDLVLKTDLSETQYQYLSIVNQSGNALLSIINDILDFSKIEAGKLELDTDKCDLFEITSQASDIITYQVQKKGLEMLLNVSPELPRYIWVDNVRLKQVLVNLLGNAAKFTEKGEIELKVTPLTYVDGEDIISLRFEVRDTGIGIKEEKQSKIFDAFSQEDTSTTKKYGGTGLGLTISNRLLQLMGSKLQLRSKPGQGSTFFFDITVQCEDSNPIIWEETNKIKKVLIVDDNDNNRLIVKSMLDLKKIESEEAKSGFEALQKLSEEQDFDLVLMDYHMPFMDGIETIKKIRETLDTAERQQPIIFLHSSSDDQNIIKACKEYKIDYKLVKPIKIEEIYAAMARVVTKKIGVTKHEVTSNEETTSHTINKGLNILIAEDNTVNMLLAEAMLNKVVPHANLIEAKDGKEVIAQCKKQIPDVILMDIQMPNMNGYDATKEIRKLYGNDIFIFALTAGNVKGEKEKCIDAGMNDFISKPFVEADLSSVFTKWLQPDESNNNESEIKRFDINVLYNYLGTNLSDSPMIKQVLEAILVELNEAKDFIAKHTDNPDVKSLQHIGHKLYGSSSSVGLNKLAEISQKLNNLTISQNVSAETLLSLEHAFEAELNEAINEINNQINAI